MDRRQFNLKALLILSLGHFVTDVYQGALPAILPFLKERLALSYSMAGIILFASNFTSSVIQPLFGLLSDRKGRPFLLPVGCLAAGISFSLIPLFPHYAAILFLVTLSGLGVAAFHPEGFKPPPISPVRKWPRACRSSRWAATSDSPLHRWSRSQS